MTLLEDLADLIGTTPAHPGVGHLASMVAEDSVARVLLLQPSMPDLATLARASVTALDALPGGPHGENLVSLMALVPGDRPALDHARAKATFDRTAGNSRILKPRYEEFMQVAEALASAIIEGRSFFTVVRFVQLSSDNLQQIIDDIQRCVLRKPSDPIPAEAMRPICSFSVRSASVAKHFLGARIAPSS